MPIETIFGIANVYPLPFWLLMILAPGWSWTRRIIGSLWIVVPLALTYTALLVLSVVTGASGGGPALDLSALSTPHGIAALLSTPEGATVGWIHFLAFDLFVGRWEYLDSRERGVNPILTGIALFFTLMAGPFGLLLYLAFRQTARRSGGTAGGTAA